MKIKYILNKLLYYIRYPIAYIRIPKGDYCYVILDVDEKTATASIRKCPYWSMRTDKPSQCGGYCRFMKVGDWENDKASLLWDQVKECGIKTDFKVN